MPSILKNGQTRPAFTHHNTSYQVFLPKSEQGRTNKKVHKIDGPQGLFELGPHLPGTVFPRIFSQLGNMYCKKVEYLLALENTVGVILGFDLGAPLAKDCEEMYAARKSDSSTVPTPLTLAPSFAGTREEQGIVAWTAWAQLPGQEVLTVHDIQFVNANTPKGTVPRHGFDFKLPTHRPTKNGDALRWKQFESGELKGPFMEDYIKNRDFKRFLYRKLLEYVCEHLYVSTYVGSDKSVKDKWALLYGANYATLRKPNGRKEAPKPGLNFTAPEVDTSVGQLMREFMKNGYDLVFESTDKDIMMCGLMAMDDVISEHAELAKNVVFHQSLYQVSHRWTEKQTLVIDVCSLWRDIHTTFAAMAKTEGFNLENPIGTYVALGCLLTNDYVHRYPQIGGTRLYRSVLRNAAVIFAKGDLVHNHWRNPAEFKVNWETFMRLSAAVWTEGKNVQINIANPKSAIDELSQPGQFAHKQGFDWALVKRTFANLTWCLRYFNLAGHKNYPLPNEFATTSDGISVYGYVKESQEMDQFGSIKVVMAKEVCIDELI